MDINQINIQGIKIDAIKPKELNEAIGFFVKKSSHLIISHVNIQAMNIAYSTPWFKDFLNSAEINFCDGSGIILAAKILSQYIPERITYADWMWNISNYCEKNKISLFFLGGDLKIAESASRILKEKYPGLVIIGTHHGYFNKTYGHPENEASIEKINHAHPDILMVGFGMPLQEKWIMENFDRLNVKVILPVGAAFDYISGNVRRAPKWMTDHGLEWLGRLIIEPRRLWKRYIIGIPLFFFRVFKQKLGLLKFPD